MASMPRCSQALAHSRPSAKSKTPPEHRRMRPRMLALSAPNFCFHRHHVQLHLQRSSRPPSPMDSSTELPTTPRNWQRPTAPQKTFCGKCGGASAYSFHHAKGVRVCPMLRTTMLRPTGTPHRQMQQPSPHALALPSGGQSIRSLGGVAWVTIGAASDKRRCLGYRQMRRYSKCVPRTQLWPHRWQRPNLII